MIMFLHLCLSKNIKENMFIEQKIKYDLRIFLIIATTLTILGCIFVYSSSSFFAFEMYKEPLYFVKKQLCGILLGIIAFYITTKIPLMFFKETSFFFFISSIILTTATLTNFGYKIHGSQRWLQITGIIFQPSELLKIALVLHIASFLSRKKITEKSILTLLPLIGIILITSIILLKQPDFGCMITLCSTTLIMFFIANLPLKYFIGAISSAIPLIFILIYTQSYRWQRILTF